MCEMCDELMHGLSADTIRGMTPPSFYFYCIFPSSLISYIWVVCVYYIYEDRNEFETFGVRTFWLAFTILHSFKGLVEGLGLVLGQRLE